MRDAKFADGVNKPHITGFARGPGRPNLANLTVVHTTIKDFAPTYLAWAAGRLAPTSLREAHRYAALVNECLGDVAIAALNPAHILALMEQLGTVEGHPTTANRCKAYVSQLCRHAERACLRPAESNPTKPIPNFPEVRRTDHIPPEQRPVYVAAVHAAVCEGAVDVNAGALLLLMFYVGLRWSCARLLRWDEVEMGRVPQLAIKARGPDREASKGGAHVRPLCRPAVEVLVSLPRVGTWVAPNPKTGRPYTEIRKQRANVYERAGIEDTGYHKLRHTTGTAAGEAGLSLAQIAAILGHRDLRSAGRYVHIAGDPANAAASAMLLSLVGKGGGDVGDCKVRNRRRGNGGRATARAEHRPGPEVAPVRRRGGAVGGFDGA